MNHCFRLENINSAVYIGKLLFREPLRYRKLPKQEVLKSLVCLWLTLKGAAD